MFNSKKNLRKSIDILVEEKSHFETETKQLNFMLQEKNNEINSLKMRKKQWEG